MIRMLETTACRAHWVYLCFIGHVLRHIHSVLCTLKYVTLVFSSKLALNSNLSKISNIKNKTKMLGLALKMLA